MSAREAAGDHCGWPHVPNQRRRPDLVAARKSYLHVLRTGSGKPATNTGACQMRVRLSWAAVAVAIAGSSYGFSRPACRRGGRTDNRHITSDDHRRPDGPVADRLQLRSGARSRHAQRHAALRKLRPALHGHRGDGQSGDDSFSIPHQSRGRERARAELRVRSPRAREAAAEIRRPRCHVGPHRAEERQQRRRKKSARTFSATTTGRSGRLETRSSPGSTPTTFDSPSCRETCSAVRP